MPERLFIHDHTDQVYRGCPGAVPGGKSEKFSLALLRMPERVEEVTFILRPDGFGDLPKKMDLEYNRGVYEIYSTELILSSGLYFYYFIRFLTLLPPV